MSRMLLAAIVLLLAPTSPLLAGELAAALRSCQLAQVQQILAQPQPLPREIDGKSPLALCHGDIAIIRALLDANVAVRPASFQLLSSRIWGGRQLKWLPPLQLYLQRDLDLNARGPVGETQVFYLAGQSLIGISVLQELLRHGADSNQPSNSGDTPLQNAVRYDHLAAAQLLLLHGASITAVNKHQQTALSVALLWRPKPNPAMVELLIEFGANPNQTERLLTEQRATQPLLHALIRSKRYEAVLLLLRLGADPRLPNSKQQTAVTLAQETNDPLLLQAIKASVERR